MNILIIASKVGTTAPGIVFERLISGLSQRHIVDVITVDSLSQEHLGNIRRIESIPLIFNSIKLEKFTISNFNISIKDEIWAKKANKISLGKFDCILSLVSSFNTHALLAGGRIAKKTKIPHYTYFVDAIPAPNGWIKRDSFYFGLEKLIQRYLMNIAGIFCANEKMLAYQVSLLGSQKIKTKGVILNPSMERSLREFHNNNKSTEFSFLYTGGFYGLRTPEILLSAFEKLTNKYNNVRLLIVGSSIESYLHNIPNNVKRNIIQYNFTKDLTPYYQQAQALIDIDAYIDNDVFLSSKIVNYISIKKPILCITGENSPSKALFDDMKSLFLARHNSEMVYEKMEQIYLNSNNIDYTDRYKFLDQFYISTVVEKLSQSIELDLNDNEN